MKHFKLKNIGILLSTMQKYTFFISVPRIYKEILLSGKTFLGLSVLVKIDLNLLFLRIIGYFRSFLVKISAFYNAYSLKLKTKPQDE